MKDGTLEVDLNHPIDDRVDAYFQIRLLAMYSFCRSAKSRKIYLMVTRRTKVVQNSAYFAGSLVFLGLVFFFPLQWYWLILFWVIFSGLFLTVIRREIVKSRRQVQLHPPMVIDPVRRTITFYRRRDLSCFQIKGEKQTFRFDEIGKIKILHTYSLRNAPQDYYRVDCAIDALMFSTPEPDGSWRDHLIFVSFGEYPCNRIAALLNEFTPIPVERLGGKWSDAYA